MITTRTFKIPNIDVCDATLVWQEGLDSLHRHITRSDHNYVSYYYLLVYYYDNIKARGLTGLDGKYTGKAMQIQWKNILHVDNQMFGYTPTNQKSLFLEVELMGNLISLTFNFTFRCIWICTLD